MTRPERSSAAMPTRARSVANGLRDAILAGEIRGGERLRQVEIAERFGVSTTPVREAFAILRREGLVEVDDHRGALVVTPSMERLREIYEIRAVLEPMAAAAAAPMLGPSVLADLERLVDALAQASDRETYLQIHHEIHAHMCRAAKRPRLLALINSMEERSTAYLQMLLDHTEDSDSVVSAHRLIVDALRYGDAERARTAVAGYIRRNLELVESLIDRNTSAQPAHCATAMSPDRKLADVQPHSAINSHRRVI